MPAPLRANDARDVLDIIEDLGHARGTAELMQRLLEQLGRVIPCVSTSFNWFSDGRVSYLAHPPMPAEDIRYLTRVMLRNWRENPLAEHFRMTADDRALRWSDLVEESVWRRSALYKEFYRPLGITDQLALRIPSPPGVAAAIVVNGHRAFDDRDTAILQRLGRHVIAQLAVMADRDAMRVALDSLGWSRLLVDDDGRLVDETAASVMGHDERISPGLRALVTETDVSRPHDRPAIIDTARGPASAIVARGPLPPHTVFVRGRGDRPVDDVSGLERSGLSRREIDVALLLQEGETNAAIARKLDISVGTVKKHLERVFRSLGVRNRTTAAGAIRELVERRRDH